MPRALFVGPVRKANEKMLPRLANVAAIYRPRSFNGERRRKEVENRGPDCVYFSLTTRRPRPRQHRPARGENRRVLHKRRIGKTQIRFERGQGQTAFRERIAITPVLLQDKIKQRSSELRRSEAGVKIASGNANDSAGEQANNPLRSWFHKRGVPGVLGGSESATSFHFIVWILIVAVRLKVANHGRSRFLNSRRIWALRLIIATTHSSWFSALL